jgi:glycerophosphoryl diester phosphodiesterase
MLAIAHRAGNTVEEMSAAIDAGVELVEADVRYYRGALELRHKKTFGRWILWDYPWEFALRSAVDVPTVGEILIELRDRGHIMLDLKGVRRAMPRKLAQVLRAAGVPVTVCTRRWWMLDAFSADPEVRLILSAGNSWELHRLLTIIQLRPRDWPGGRRAYGVSVKRTLLTPRIVAELHRNVDVVMTWRVETPIELDDARRLGVTGAIGKNVEVLREFIVSS